MNKILAALMTASLALPAVVRADALLITGAGATFPFPLYSKWFADYNKKNPDLRFNYQSIGSTGVATSSSTDIATPRASSSFLLATVAGSGSSTRGAHPSCVARAS